MLDGILSNLTIFEVISFFLLRFMACVILVVYAYEIEKEKRLKFFSTQKKVNILLKLKEA